MFASNSINSHNSVENSVRVCPFIEQIGVHDMFGPLAEYPWPSQMKEFTGYNVEDIAKCAVHIHFKWYVHTEFISRHFI